MANCAKAATRTAAPAAIITTPATRTGTGHELPACQPVSHHGTSPATTPGATTRNTTLPATAVSFRIGPPSPQSLSHIVGTGTGSRAAVRQWRYGFPVGVRA